MQNKIKRIAILFGRLGPYHIARIEAAVPTLRSVGWDAFALEVAGFDTTYLWRQEMAKHEWDRVTLFPNSEHEQLATRQVMQAVKRELDRLRPEAVAICGYSTPDSWAAQKWCKKNRATSILMSETRREDGQRRWWKEFIKSHFVRRFDAAICGGKRHRDYLIELGIQERKIHFGYDVVDNEYFASQAGEIRAEKSLAVQPYFHSSNRFIPRKNLLALLDAYQTYGQMTAANDHHQDLWPLVLLGDGEQQPSLINRCILNNLRIVETAPWEDDALGIDRTQPTVYFPGFRQIEELPQYYAGAGCFIHPAVAEPWGLVLNEAMSSSLPILASRGTGAAIDLIEEGVNGWCFDASDVLGLAGLMSRVAQMSEVERQRFGAASLERIRDKYSVAAFGEGLVNALESANALHK